MYCKALKKEKKKLIDRRQVEVHFKMETDMDQTSSAVLRSVKHFPKCVTSVHQFLHNFTYHKPEHFQVLCNQTDTKVLKLKRASIENCTGWTVCRTIAQPAVLSAIQNLRAA